ncbi:ion channel family protein [Acidobacterium capsulatum ATCC 51196]|uniref:Ion channel family protein n=1 Tax=Acidobacterium capsulatum (strain ATCC 51196 / DSM 11244 / BCRC 80197 / JCM 7670 / NBRC 15755 / NCIMB 13165 / 161) TaxID=240015 RepID=C1F7F0_ACIC5|nr:ion channel family protein [Acidobacterium capsulatum ATCC 51196]
MVSASHKHSGSRDNAHRGARSSRHSWRHWIRVHEARLFLVALLLLTLLSPLADLWKYGRLLLGPPVVLIVLTTVHYGQASRRTFWIALVAAMGWLVTLPGVGPFPANPWWSSLLMIVLSLLMLAMMGRQFIGARSVNVETMFAALSGYLLLATLWSQIYALIAAVRPEAFHFGGSGPPKLYSLMYFSLQTLTSLGLGDVLPVDPFARMLTVVETVLGQFYLAAVIGRLASLARPEEESTE